MKINLQYSTCVCQSINFTMTSPDQISEGPNPAIEDLSPDRGNITIPVGQAVVHFSILIKDDQVLNRLFTAPFKPPACHIYGLGCFHLSLHRLCQFDYLA